MQSLPILQHISFQIRLSQTTYSECSGVYGEVVHSEQSQFSGNIYFLLLHLWRKTQTPSSELLNCVYY